MLKAVPGLLIDIPCKSAPDSPFAVLYPANRAILLNSVLGTDLPGTKNNFVTKVAE